MLIFVTRLLVMFLRVFNTDSSEGLEILTRITLGLSHLADHRFRHNFQDCVNPICSCGREIKT